MGALWQAIRYCRADSVLVEGKEIRTGEPLRLFYFGKANDDNFHWVTAILYSDFRIREIRRNVFSFRAMHWLKKWGKEADLAVLALGRAYAGAVSFLDKNFLFLPCLISQKRDLCGSMEELRNSFREHRRYKYVARIEKQGITRRIVDSEECFREFYDDYYLPFARKRFGDAADLATGSDFLRRCRDGSVMQVAHGDEVIAYALLEADRGALRCAFLGVSGRIAGEQHKIVFNALYYFSILHGFENGFRAVDYMYSRPLLNDGVYRFKRMWGGYVCGFPESMDRILVKPMNLGAPVIGIFSNNHFISLKDGKFVATVACRDGELSPPFIERVMKDGYSKGIDAVRMVSLTPVDPSVGAWCRENAPAVEIVDLSAGKAPHEAFCT